MKHHIPSAFLLLLLAAGPVAAQVPAAAPAAAPAATVTLTPAFVSQYMLRGVRLGGPSLQPTLEYASGPLAVGVWASTPLSAKVPGQSDPEIDPYASYTVEITKDLSIQPGLTLYTYPRAEKRNGFYRSTVEPSLAVNYTVEGVKFTPKLYRDVVLEQTLLEVSVAYAVPLKDIGSELSFLGTYGTLKATDALADTNPRAKNWGDYWLAGVTLPFQLSKESKVSVGWAYTKGSGNFFKQGNAPKVENSAAVGRGVLSLAYAITF
jgi:uncharacterized protein (TIGR02001 family)